MSIRPLELSDIDAVLAIQSLCPEIAQWVGREYESVACGELTGWIAQEEAGIVGFVVARRIGDDFEILNLAVRPDSRQRGIGSRLLKAALEWARTFRAGRAQLEVRASNLAAIKFYERFRFEVTARRPRYYTAPVEDALLLTAQLR